MCVGLEDECANCICTPIFIVALPIVGMYRAFQVIFWDVPFYLYRLTKKSVTKQNVKPRATSSELSPTDARRAIGGVVTWPRVEEHPQPPSLRITIPVSEDPVEV